MRIMNERTRPVPAQSIFNPSINPAIFLQVPGMKSVSLPLNAGTAEKPLNIFYEYSDKVTRNLILCLFIPMGTQTGWY